MAVNKYKNNEVIFMESSVRYETTKFFQNKNVVVWRFRIKKGQPFVNIELEHGTTGGKRNFLVGGYVVKSYKDFMNSNSVDEIPIFDGLHKAVISIKSDHYGDEEDGVFKGYKYLIKIDDDGREMAIGEDLMWRYGEADELEQQDRARVEKANASGLEKGKK